MIPFSLKQAIDALAAITGHKYAVEVLEPETFAKPPSRAKKLTGQKPAGGWWNREQ